MVHTGRNCFALRRIAVRFLLQCNCFIAMACLGIGNDSIREANLPQAVQNHLDAGEFGRAMSLTLATNSVDEQSALLGQIANAQQAAGETESAIGTRRRIPRAARRGTTSAAPTGLAGGGIGGGGANPGILIALIQNTIIGENVKWSDGFTDGGTIQPYPPSSNYPMGVKVAPGGLLARVTGEEMSGRLSTVGIQARQADLNEDVARKSSLRMVSLTRLERAVAQRIEEGLAVPETMAQMAGLSHIKYVFVYPDSNEIVIAGPADGWRYNSHGQPVSLMDGTPTLQLDDLVTVLRTFASGQSDFGCSINTRDEGAKALKEFVEKSQASGPVSDTQGWVKQLQKKLGRQDIVVWGVPTNSRVARVIVEADYLMKLIGIGRLDAGKEVPSYFDLLSVAEQKKSSNIDALRWWLTLQADGVSHSADKCVFEIHGSAVLCQSENQLLKADGKHEPTGQAEATNRQFAQNFTANYAKLASKELVFADTMNIFNMALCSALIQNERLADKAGWNLGIFAPNGAYLTTTYASPKEVESVVNHRVYRGRDIVVQVAGGVTSNAMSTAKDPQRNRTEPQLANVGSTAKAPQLPVGRWWWDATN